MSAETKLRRTEEGGGTATHETPVQRSHTLVLRNLRDLHKRPPDLLPRRHRLRSALPNVTRGIERRTDESTDGTGNKVIKERRGRRLGFWEESADLENAAEVAAVPKDMPGGANGSAG